MGDGYGGGTRVPKPFGMREEPSLPRPRSRSRSCAARSRFRTHRESPTGRGAHIHYYNLADDPEAAMKAATAELSPQAGVVGPEEDARPDLRAPLFQRGCSCA